MTGHVHPTCRNRPLSSPPPVSSNIIITSQMHCAKCIIPLQSAKKFFTWKALFLKKMMALTDYETIQLFDEKYGIMCCVLFFFAVSFCYKKQMELIPCKLKDAFLGNCLIIGPWNVMWKKLWVLPSYHVQSCWGRYICLESSRRLYSALPGWCCIESPTVWH